MYYVFYVVLCYVSVYACMGFFPPFAWSALEQTPFFVGLSHIHSVTVSCTVQYGVPRPAGRYSWSSEAVFSGSCFSWYSFLHLSRLIEASSRSQNHSLWG